MVSIKFVSKTFMHDENPIYQYLDQTSLNGLINEHLIIIKPTFNSLVLFECFEIFGTSWLRYSLKKVFAKIRLPSQST